jgi:hypothetical protein
MTEHCWHSTGDSFTNSWEASTKVTCCWCGAFALRITRRIGRDRVDGHGPFYEEQREVTRIEITHGDQRCPRKSLLLTESATDESV